MIDLRSDTVTLPSDEMRRAMANAEVGDDVYGEDATVNQLEKISADRMGKEAGLFLTSGTMGNLIAVLANCQRGEEVIMGSLSHTFLHEVGGISALGGVMAHTLPNQVDGTIKTEEIANAIRGEDIHEPVTRMIILENTQNRCGGVVLPIEYTDQVAALAKERNLKFHLDGARIFNAAVKLNLPVEELVKPFDSVTFCLSKGLGAPVGSVLCGNREFIYKARRLRKQLGGGMRQAGILAAAGIFALERNVDRLEHDHILASTLAQGLRSVQHIWIKDGSPQTNMVFIDLTFHSHLNMSVLNQNLISRGIKVDVINNQTMRLVTHLGITEDDIEKVIIAFRSILE